MDRRIIIASIRFVFVTTLAVNGHFQSALAAPPSAPTRESTAVRKSTTVLQSEILRQSPTSEPSTAPSLAPKRVIKPLPTLTPEEAATVVAELRKKHLLLPIDGVSPDTIKGMFCLDRGGEMHRAVDIVAPRNTPVLATDSGRVVKLWNSAAGGITLYQNDATGRFIYYYAHLESYAPNIKEGDQVQKGQIIGYVGTSGNAPKNTPHLHFAIYKAPLVRTWYGGAPVDPWEVYTDTKLQHQH